jgi:hypothetical protein
VWSNAMLAPDVIYGKTPIPVPTPPPLPVPGGPEMDAQERAQMDRIEAMLGNGEKAGVLHDMNVRIQNLEKALFNPGATGPTILRNIEGDTIALREAAGKPRKLEGVHALTSTPEIPPGEPHDAPPA